MDLDLYDPTSATAESEPTLIGYCDECGEDVGPALGCCSCGRVCVEETLSPDVLT